MTGIELVVRLVTKRGSSSVDDLVDICPEMTRPQIMKALDNATARGYLASLGRSSKKGAMGIPTAIYEPTGKQPPERRFKGPKGHYVGADPILAPRGEYGHIGRIASVWDLARLAA